MVLHTPYEISETLSEHRTMPVDAAGGAHALPGLPELGCRLGVSYFLSYKS